MNKGSLRTQFKAVLNRSDITDTLADTFIDQGITRIQRTLRIPSMETQHTYSISSSTTSVVLPSDFLEAIDLYYDNRTLVRIPMAEMQNLKQADTQGSPYYFTREGSKFLISPYPSSGSLTLNYYAQFVAMNSDTDENVLATIASDLIIYAALTYASDYYLDERSPVFEGKYQAFLDEIQVQADDQELAGSLQSIRPAYAL
tara:strand:- start:1996 stop:2598 length:603 start_codon:yes stop_codon:yes gene_type:complete